MLRRKGIHNKTVTEHTAKIAIHPRQGFSSIVALITTHYSWNNSNRRVVHLSSDSFQGGLNGGRLECEYYPYSPALFLSSEYF